MTREWKLVPAKNEKQARQIAATHYPGFVPDDGVGVRKLPAETTELGFFQVFGEQAELDSSGDVSTTCDPSDPWCLPGGA